jgi:hypothetical protein
VVEILLSVIGGALLVQVSQKVPPSQGVAYIVISLVLAVVVWVVARLLSGILPT